MPQTVVHDSPRLIRGRNNFIPRAVCLVGASSVDAAPYEFFATHTYAAQDTS